MSDRTLLQRIVIDSSVMVGQPVIRGTRLTVSFILGLLAHGETAAQIVEEYEGLDEADVQACLLFARDSVESSTFLPLEATGA